MKRFITALLALTLLVPAGLPVDAQFPFPVAHFSEAEAGGGGGSTAGAEATQFESGDYLSKTSATGYSDSTTFLYSTWIKLDSLPTPSFNTGALFRIEGTSTVGFSVAITGNGAIAVLSRDSSQNNIVNSSSANSVISADGNWHHIAISVETGSAFQMYLDGSSLLDTGETAGTLDLTRTQYRVARDAAGASALLYSESERYLQIGARIDLSTDMTKLRTAGGLPAELGADGSDVTGTQPVEYSPDGQDQLGTGSAWTLNGTPSVVSGPNP